MTTNYLIQKTVLTFAYMLPTSHLFAGKVERLHARCVNNVPQSGGGRAHPALQKREGGVRCANGSLDHALDASTGGVLIVIERSIERV